MKREKSNYRIQTVEYAFDVLEQFLANGNEIGVTELSRRLNLSKNIIFRLLATLETRSYIEQNRSTEGYRLGIKNLELGQSVIRQMEFHRQARPVLESLVAECNETSDVAIPRGAHICYLHAVESSHPVRVIPRVGIVQPACCTAAGKVLLACTTEMEQNNRLPAEDICQKAPHAIIDRNELVEQLRKIALQGYAVEDEELDMGVRGVAAPVRDHTGCVIGAVSIFGPTVRFSKERMDDELVPMVKESAEALSMRLGYPAVAAVMEGTRAFAEPSF